MSLSYRKTPSGEWVAYGPAGEFPVPKHGKPPISVTLKDGTRKREFLVRLGEVFEVDRVPMRYGYLESEAAKAGASQAAARCAGRSSEQDRLRRNRDLLRRAGIGPDRTGKSCISGGNCSSFGNGSTCGGYDCDGW
jgi:hypothetical protein